MIRPSNLSVSAYGLGTVRNRRMMLISLTALFLSLAYATGPEVMLGYRSSDFRRAEVSLQLERAALERTALGLGASLELRPFLEYAEDLSEPVEAPSFGPGVEGIASLGYTYNYPAILLASTEVLQAEKRVADTRRESVRAALMAYTDLLMAQLNVRREAEALAENRRDLTERSADYRAGNATETELAMARLGLESDTRSFAYAERTLHDVMELTQRYGFKGSAHLVPLSFMLPEIAPKDTLTYRIAQRQFDYTQAMAQQRSVYGVIDEVRLGTRYNGDDLELSGGIGLEQGLPTADVSAHYKDRESEAWTITLRATIRLDDDTVDDFDGASREVANAQEDLTELVSDLAERLKDARAAAVFDASSVATSARDLELIIRRIEELEGQMAAQPRQLAALERERDRAQRRFEALRSQRESETEPAEQQTLDAALTLQEGLVNEAQAAFDEAQQESAAAEAELGQYREFRGISEENFYRAWSEYIQSADAYLALADAGWSLE